MLVRWLLFACLLPGWILPSGIALPLCGCALSFEADACCMVPADATTGEAQDESCCAVESTTSEQDESARETECCCTVESPSHDEPCPRNCAWPAWKGARLAPVFARACLPPACFPRIVDDLRTLAPGPAPGERPGTPGAPLRL